MALNITFTGNIYLADGTPVTDNSISYQAYFQKINATSSASKWNNPNVTEYGQYSLNLGDGDFLTQDGGASANDKVIILFWKEKEENKASNTLKEWCLIETNLNGSELYISDIKLSEGIKPNINFIRSGSNKVGKSVVFNDNGSNDEHSYLFKGKTLKQLKAYFSGMNTLPLGCVKINWGDSTLEQTFNAGISYSHIYSQPGIYEVTIYLTNVYGLTSSMIFSIQIFWNDPIVDFTLNSSSFKPQNENGKGTDVICTNTTTDPDSRDIIDNWYYNWIFTTRTDNNKLKVYSPIYNCLSTGNHNITLQCNYYDGFNWQVKSITKQIYQDSWSIAQDMLWNEPVYLNIENEYLPEIFGDIIHTKNIDVYINGILTYTPQISYSFFHTFTTSQPQIITIKVTYHNGFELMEIEKSYTILMSSLCSFRHETNDQGIKFISTSIAGSPPFTAFLWQVFSIPSNELMAELGGANTEEFTYTLFKVGEYKIKLSVTDSSNVVSTAEGIFVQKFTTGGDKIIYVTEIIKVNIIDEPITVNVIEDIYTITIEDDELDIKLDEEIQKINIKE